MSNKFHKAIIINLVLCSCMGFGSIQASARHVSYHHKSVKIVKHHKKNTGIISIFKDLFNNKKKTRHLQSNNHHKKSAAQWYYDNREKLIKGHRTPSLMINSNKCHLFHEGEGDSTGNTTISSSGGGSFMNNMESFSTSYREGWIIARARYEAYANNSKSITVKDYQKAINQYKHGFHLTRNHKIMFTVSGRKLKGPGVGAVSTNGYHWKYLQD